MFSSPSEYSEERERKQLDEFTHATTQIRIRRVPSHARRKRGISTPTYSS
jgi:hypothetical protein